MDIILIGAIVGIIASIVSIIANFDKLNSLYKKWKKKRRKQLTFYILDKRDFSIEEFKPNREGSKKSQKKVKK